MASSDLQKFLALTSHLGGGQAPTVPLQPDTPAGYGNDVSAGLTAGKAGAKQKLYKALQLTGMDTGREADYQGLVAEEASRNVAAPQQLSDIKSLGGLVGFAEQGLAKSAAEMGVGLAAGAAATLATGNPALGVAAAAASQFPFGVGESVQSQMDQGATIDQVSRKAALLGGAGYAAAGALAPELGLLKAAMGGTGKGVLRGAAAGVPLAAGKEGAEETLQTLATDVAQRRVVDQNYDMLGQDARGRLGEAFVAGAILGAPVGAVVGGYEGRAAPSLAEPGAEADLLSKPAPVAPQVEAPQRGLDLPVETGPAQIAGLLPAPTDYVAGAGGVAAPDYTQQADLQNQALAGRLDPALYGQVGQEPAGERQQQPLGLRAIFPFAAGAAPRAPRIDNRPIPSGVPEGRATPGYGQRDIFSGKVYPVDNTPVEQTQEQAAPARDPNTPDMFGGDDFVGPYPAEQRGQLRQYMTQNKIKPKSPLGKAMISVLNGTQSVNGLKDWLVSEGESIDASAYPKYDAAYRELSGGESIDEALARRAEAAAQETPNATPSEPAAPQPEPVASAEAAPPVGAVQPAGGEVAPSDTPKRGRVRANAEAAGQPDGEAVRAVPAAAEQQPALGSDVGNGFKRGPAGYKYRTAVSKALNGGVVLEKRSEGGSASTFVVGKDGNLIDSDSIAHNRPETKENIWQPTDEQAAQALGLLDEMGKLELKDPKRQALKQKLKDLVTGAGEYVGAGEAASTTPAETAAKPAPAKPVSDVKPSKTAVNPEKPTGEVARTPQEKRAFERKTRAIKAAERAGVPESITAELDQQIMDASESMQEFWNRSATALEKATEKHKREQARADREATKGLDFDVEPDDRTFEAKRKAARQAALTEARRTFGNLNADLGGLNEDIIDDTLQKTAQGGSSVTPNVGWQTADSLPKSLVEDFPRMGQKLLDSGRIVVHETAADASKATGVQLRGKPYGFIDRNGTIHLIANNIPRAELRATVLHEMFHAGVEALIGSKAWQATLKRLDALRKQAGNGAKVDEFIAAGVKAAEADAANAAKKGQTLSDMHIAEEVAAYALDNYDQAPPRVRNLVDNLLGMVKAFLLKTFGIQAGAVTPAQLRELAIAALRADRAPGRATVSPAMQKSETVPDTPAGKAYNAMSDVRRTFLNNPRVRVGLRKAKRATLGMMTNGQIVEVYGKVMPTLKRLGDLMKLQESLKNSIVKDYDKLFRDLRTYLDNATPEKRQAVQKLMYDARLAGIWFDRPLEDQPWLSRAQRDAEGKLVKDEEGKSVMEFPEEVQAKYNELAGMWEQMSPADQSMISRVFEQASDLRNREQAALIGEFIRTSAPEIAKVAEGVQGELMAAINDMANTTYQSDVYNAARARLLELRKQLNDRGDYLVNMLANSISEIKQTIGRPGPYLPLLRRGDFVYVAKSERFREAEEKLKQLLAEQERLSAEDANQPALRAARQVLADATRAEEKATKALRRAPTERNTQVLANASIAVREARTALAQLEDAQRKSPYFAAKNAVNQQRQVIKDLETNLEDYEVRFGTELELEQLKEKSGRGTVAPRAEVLRAQDYGTSFQAVVTDLSNKTMSEQDAAALRAVMADARLHMAAETSYLKRQMKSRDIEGFSRDLLVNFAENTRAAARRVANVTYGRQVGEALQDLRTEDGPVEQVNSIYNEMSARHAITMQADTTPVQDFISKLGAFWYLGATPAFPILNATQGALVTYPMLGAKFGFRKAGSALLNAVKDTADIYHVKNLFKKGALSYEVDFENSKLSDGEKEMLRKLYDLGRLNVSQVLEMADVNKDARLDAINRMAWHLPHHTEVMNRVYSSLAAYRLAKSAGMNQEAATQEALTILDNSHGDYNQDNKSRYFRQIYKPLTLFKSYAQMMAYAVLRNAYLSVKGGTAEERRVARRTLFGMAVMHQIIAGAVGLPGIGLIGGLAGLFAGDDDEPWEWKTELRGFLKDVAGEDVGGMLYGGILPTIGSRASAADVLTLGIKLSGDPAKQGKDELVNQLFTNVGGPAGSIAAGIADGYDTAWNRGEYAKGVAQALPRFAKDVVEGYLESTEGKTNKRGVVLEEPEWDDLALKFMGLRSAAAIESAEIRSSRYLYGTTIKNARNVLLNRAARGEDVADEVQEFNAKNPARPIKPFDIRNAARRFKKQQASVVNGVIMEERDADLPSE